MPRDSPTPGESLRIPTGEPLNDVPLGGGLSVPEGESHLELPRQNPGVRPSWEAFAGAGGISRSWLQDRSLQPRLGRMDICWVLFINNCN